MATRLEQELGIEHLGWFNVAGGSPKPIQSMEPPNARVDDQRRYIRYRPQGWSAGSRKSAPVHKP